MVISADSLVAFLQNVYPYHLLDHGILQSIAGFFEPIEVNEGTIIYEAGDVPDYFYVLVSGAILQEKEDRKGNLTSEHVIPGDHFGEEALHDKEYRLSRASAQVNSIMLRLNQDAIRILSEGNLKVKNAYYLMHQSFRLKQSLKLKWQTEGEKVTLISRRHPFFLFLRVLLVGGAGFAGFGIFLSLAFTSLGFSIGLFITAIVLLVIGLLLSGWAALEWTNDFFIITRDRVLVQKKLIGFFESRHESPMSAILSTGLETTLPGRIIGFGAVTLRSYTGNIRFKNLPSPQLIYEFLEHQRQQVALETNQQDRVEMVETLQERLGVEGRPSRIVAREREMPVSMYASGSLLDLAASFFGLRIEKDSAVIYRTHWWILLGKTIIPGIILFGTGAAFLGKLLGLFPPIPDTVFYIAAILLTLISFTWWLYQYTDWHNDIYIITPDQLVDVYRKPLGTEERRSAPIRNIQTVEFMRKGIIGLILNYGTVRIQIGNEELTFDNVYDPAAIQTEIFTCFKRFEGLLKHTEQQKFAEWIQTYDEIRRKGMER